MPSSPVLLVIYDFLIIADLVTATYLGGAGYHMEQLNKWHVGRITQSFLVIQALYGLSMCAAKWSMLFMLKRIFAVRYFKVITLQPNPSTPEPDPEKKRG